MLYTIVDENWTPGTPLPASGTRVGLFRTRREAEDIAGGRGLLSVAVRYDATRGLVIATPPGEGEPSSVWVAPAIQGPSGGVTALAAIPARLVRMVGPARLRVHAGHPDRGARIASNRKVPSGKS